MGFAAVSPNSASAVNERKARGLGGRGLQVDDAAARIRKGLQAQQQRIRFPKRLVLSLHLLNLLPYALRCKVAAGMRQP